MVSDANTEKRARHLLRLRAIGLSDTALLKAVEATPRENFVSSRWHSESYTSRSLPIACGQDMTSAEEVARIVDAMRLDPSSRVLELGTGSGYQASIISHMCRQLVTMERYATLLDNAKAQLEYLGQLNVDYVLADGIEGNAKLGPYDHIIANFSYPEAPRYFIDQMTTGARLLLPIEISPTRQMMTAFTKIGSRFETEELFEVSFAPPIAGVAKAT